MTTTSSPAGAGQASTAARLANLYRPLRTAAVAMIVVTVALGVISAATLPDPMVVGWTFAADGSLVAQHTLTPVLGGLLFPALATVMLASAATVSVLSGSRALGVVTYALSSLFIGTFCVSQILLLVLNLG